MVAQDNPYDKFWLSEVTDRCFECTSWGTETTSQNASFPLLPPTNFVSLANRKRSLSPSGGNITFAALVQESVTFQSFGGERMKQAKVLSSEELKRVMAICATMQNGKRNRLMLMLSHYAGMSVIFGLGEEGFTENQYTGPLRDDEIELKVEFFQDVWFWKFTLLTDWEKSLELFGDIADFVNRRHPPADQYALSDQDQNSSISTAKILEIHRSQARK